MLTTILAIISATAVFYLLHPGNPELASKLAADASTVVSSDVSISIKGYHCWHCAGQLCQTISGIEYDAADFHGDFNRALQWAKIGEYSQLLKDIFEACNSLFLKITVIFSPFYSDCHILFHFIRDPEDRTGCAASMLAMLGTFAVGILVMMCIYCLLIILIGGMNPIPFFKKYSPTMLQVFGMASSNAAIIVNMDACEHKLSIPKKIYSLSIPLGATVNMDGTCVYLVIFGLALARVFGVEISGGMLLSMFFLRTCAFCGGTRGTGAGLVCLSVLLTQLNVPIAGIGLVMGLDSLLGMMRAMSNSLGDVAASLIVAKSEKTLDCEKYEAIKVVLTIPCFIG